MKKTFLCIIAILVSCIAFFTGCFNDGNGNEPEDATPKEYIIQYTDDNGTHKLTVTEGMPYSLEEIPSRVGHNFKGLFTAEVGGVQYVSASGASLSLFSDSKNLILFPQFEPKEYTVILDYQGAAVTGERQLTVIYGSNLPNLPDIADNFTDGGKEFTGWYTQENCGGKQISDEYGLIPLVSVLNEQNFDLSENYFYLYAGFKDKKMNVSLNFGAGVESEYLQVAYDTHVSKIVSETRVDGKAPISWSKLPNGNVFNGKITEDTDLYAIEFAPVLEFDSNGGDQITPIVARAGDSISLPAPSRENYKFTGWQTSGGKEFNSTTMPESSLKLNAKWQAMIIFDANGGTEVDNVSEPQGTAITLPAAERDGYIFAGWYTEDKQKAALTAMPGESVCLKAGWYEISSESFYLINDKKGVLIASGVPEIADDYRDSLGWEYSYYRTLSLSEILNGQSLYIELKFSATLSARFTGSNADINIELFSAPSTGSTYLLHKVSTNVTSQSKKQISWDLKIQADNDLYICYYKSGSQTFINNLYCEVIYPNLNYLYL